MIRELDFRVDVLRLGVPYSSLTFSQTTPPTLSCASDSEIAMTLSGVFLHNDAVDYLSDELRPVLIVDGAEHPCGVFRVVSSHAQTNAAGVTYDQLECCDRAVLLKWHKLEKRDFWPAGTSYDTVISHYLIDAGITRVSFTPSAHVLQSDREDWDIGTEYLTIINQLLSEINYAALFFDPSGTAILRPYAAPSVSSIKHTYGEGEGARLTSPGFSADLDLFSRPNVIICILENPEYPEPLVATSVNDFPSSALSTIRRGMRIPEIVKVSNIASPDELQAYADRLRNEAMQTSEFIEIESGIQPGHSVADTVARVGFEREGIYRETAWSFPLAAGQKMRHKLERTVMI